MPPFNGRQIQQQLRAFLVFIQLQIIMYFHFLRRPQQPPPAAPAPIQRPRRRHNMWVRPWLLQREERGAALQIPQWKLPGCLEGSFKVLRLIGVNRVPVSRPRDEDRNVSLLGTFIMSHPNHLVC